MEIWNRNCVKNLVLNEYDILVWNMNLISDKNWTTFCM